LRRCWRPGSGRIGAERATVVRIVTDSAPDTIRRFDRRFEEIRGADRSRFAQDSVGLVTAAGCAAVCEWQQQCCHATHD
jgi:hypothetical protein